MWAAGVSGRPVSLGFVSGSAGAFKELVSARAPEAQGARRVCPPAEVPGINTRERVGAGQITGGE